MSNFYFIHSVETPKQSNSLVYFLLCPFQKSSKFSLALHFFLWNNGIFIEMRSLCAYFKVLILAQNSSGIGSCEICPLEEMLNPQIWCGNCEVVPSNLPLSAREVPLTIQKQLHLKFEQNFCSLMGYNFPLSGISYSTCPSSGLCHTKRRECNFQPPVENC